MNPRFNAAPSEPASGRATMATSEPANPVPNRQNRPQLSAAARRPVTAAWNAAVTSLSRPMPKAGYSAGENAGASGRFSDRSNAQSRRCLSAVFAARVPAVLAAVGPGQSAGTLRSASSMPAVWQYGQ